MRIIELFAGVGGFRIGLEQVSRDFYCTVWSNQFEPATKNQHASDIYIARFGAEGHVNKDIALVDSNEIPAHDMLVGGFPCQDYSVATSLNNSRGIEGKKGVLWWEICRIIRDKGEQKPSIVFLENVDRLLLSPAKQRGRDFAIILDSLHDLGYNVEWRIINAADYGMPQRRRRTYILAYHRNSLIAQQMCDAVDWIYTDGVFARAFPVKDYEGGDPLAGFQLTGKKESLIDISDNFNKENRERPFENSGIMIGGIVYTSRTIPLYENQGMTIRDILVQGEDRRFITEDFYIREEDIERWQYCKGAKCEKRTKKNGIEYYYKEGAMDFPDSLDKPSRTIITSEGGKRPDRCRHIIRDIDGRLRRLIPIELERLNMFPDNHTLLDGVNDVKRGFLMGNALVCGVITRVGQELRERLE